MYGTALARGACRGRFAPSPTGPLHLGSMVAALGSWLDARFRGGAWLVRLEDLDRARCRPEHERTILAQLAACGLVADAPPERQSDRTERYVDALDALAAASWSYRCACSRAEVQAAARRAAAPGEDAVYPGTCRHGLGGRAPRVTRVRAAVMRDTSPAAAPASLVLDWHDRRLGPGRQDVSAEVGDFVVERAEGFAAYQLAVVVDDAAQGVTDVVRGEDLADNTPRQIHLQRLLGLPTPRYLHLPLVLGADGRKLSKSAGAEAIDPEADPLTALRAAGRVLGIEVEADAPAAWLGSAVRAWADAPWAASD